MNIIIDKPGLVSRAALSELTLVLTRYYIELGAEPEKAFRAARLDLAPEYAELETTPQQ